VDAEIVPLRLAGGRLAAPPDGSRAGWYEQGTSPGELGSAVIVGRAAPARPRGPAVFARLDRLAAGDGVEVVREDGAVAAFVVDRVERFTTERLHHDTGAEAQLRLVSRNLVVWATLAQ
jgi:Sortase domain